MVANFSAEHDADLTPIVVVSGDVFTDFDYGSLVPTLQKISAGEVDAHFVLADNPPFHLTGDFAIRDGLATRIGQRLNFAGITCWHPKVFRNVPVGVPQRLFPWADTLVANDRVSAEHYPGLWENIGTPEQLASLRQRLSAKMSK
jgi:MurNAc alpha-1-phosphate uridylyltransferase